MPHTVIEPLAPPKARPPKRRTVRLSERLNRGAHWARAELLTLARPAPTETPRPKSSLVLTGAALTASAAGIALLSGVALRPLPNRVDIAATRLLQRRHSRAVTRAMLLISAPGFAPLQHVLTVGTAIDMWALGCRREALATMLTMGAGAITGVIKIAVGRPRARGLPVPRQQLPQRPLRALRLVLWVHVLPGAPLYEALTPAHGHYGGVHGDRDARSAVARLPGAPLEQRCHRWRTRRANLSVRAD